MVALRLSRAGYGTPEQILAMRSDLALAAAAYEGFLADYEAAFVELNREGADG